MICMYIPVAQDIIYKYHISMPTRAYQSINPSSKDGQEDKHVGLELEISSNYFRHQKNSNLSIYMASYLLQTDQ